MFENDVEMYGAQAKDKPNPYNGEFENDVEMYGAQACRLDIKASSMFENDVEMYGAQAKDTFSHLPFCLRMM